MTIKIVLLFFVDILTRAYFDSMESAYPFIYNYGPDDLKQSVQTMDGRFVMFYTPWCIQCKEFQPIWNNLAEKINTENTQFAIAQVDCSVHQRLCHETDITGYPILMYFDKLFSPAEYQGTRDLPSLTLYLEDILNRSLKNPSIILPPNQVRIHSGMAYLTDQNIEKFVSRGQHFILFYVPWCKKSQRQAPAWAELASKYAKNISLQIGKMNCIDHSLSCSNFEVKAYPYMLWIVDGKVMGGITNLHNIQQFEEFISIMAQPENHNPDRFMKKEKMLPVAKILQDTFDIYMKKDFVFINYYVPWCAHCKQLSQIWQKLGERYQNDSRIIIGDVDCSQSDILCTQEDVFQFPSLVLYHNSKPLYQQHGSTSLENLVELVDHYIKKLWTTTRTKDEL